MCLSEWMNKKRVEKKEGEKKGAQMEGQGRGDQTQLPWQQMEADVGMRERERNRKGGESMMHLRHIKRMLIWIYLPHPL